MGWGKTAPSTVRVFEASRSPVWPALILTRIDGAHRPSGITDVNVDAVLLAFYLNSGVFVGAVCLFEVLRRTLPTIYNGSFYHKSAERVPKRLPVEVSLSSIFGLWKQVYRVPWHQVLCCAGLDAYMFLRYIRLCGRITSVSAFWGTLVLGSVYYTGGGGETGWYKLSMKNIPTIGNSDDDDDGSQVHDDQSEIEERGDSRRLWVPVAFCYLMTFYTIYLLTEEYKHYVELRMDYLTRGDVDVGAQKRFSVMVENIPSSLRSETKLLAYFNRLFPGNVHSVSVVLSIPEVDKLNQRRERVRRRLEKAVAIREATGREAMHYVGHARCYCCGVESTPNPFKCCSKEDKTNSVEYYTEELSQMNREIKAMVEEKLAIEREGCDQEDANGIFVRIKDAVRDVVVGRSVSTAVEEYDGADRGYGSFNQEDARGLSKSGDERGAHGDGMWGGEDDKSNSLIVEDYLRGNEGYTKSPAINPNLDLIQPGGRDKHKSILRRFLNKLGLDFLDSGIAFVREKFNRVVVDSVFVRTMSSTGFVTFKSLQTVSCASSTILTHKPDTLDVGVAPEPRDIYWPNAHVSRPVSAAKENTASVAIAFGALLWSIPVSAIQAMATAEQLSKIPGLGWLVEVTDDEEANRTKEFYVHLLNGYLPVVTLLGLILLLPVIFQWVAVHYEIRKTKSDIQRSILRRFFYYQMANIYVSITAGSIMENLQDIVDKPSSILIVLSDTVPAVVGYFISLIMTKILAGLPVVLLRTGALLRMGFLRLCFSKKMLTQRELNEIYCKQEFLYGWEYPTQLLVIVICFTYSCIAPLILSAGAIYFTAALMVYKLQLLYVYTPEYEGGGELYPSVCHRTLIGLCCGQVTLLAYLLIRVGSSGWQPFVLIPLPFLTIYIMYRTKEQYDEPSMALSLERAVALDHENEKSGAALELVETFDKYAYRQPILDPSSLHMAAEPHRAVRSTGALQEERSTENNLQNDSVSNNL